MSTAEVLHARHHELNRLAHAGLDSFSYRERAIGKLRGVVPFDAAWWWTTDPATSFFTSGVFEPFPTDHAICGALHANEFGDTDYNKFRVLARRSGRVGVLSAATGGRLERSDRYQHMLAPMGYKHELRLALSDNSTLWGALALVRAPGARDFSPSEARRIASVGNTLTEGLRIGLVLGAVSVDSTPNGPGMLIVDNDLEILTMTPNAECWLAELSDGCPGLPEAVRSVVGYVTRLDVGDAPEQGIPRARVRGASGRWLTIYASRTRESGSMAANTAVIIEEAKPAEIAPLIVHAYGLSPREARVTRMVLQGLSTKEIAAEIHLSPYTVQDHLKAVFEKVGVRSRRELVARIFDQHHWPRFGLGENAPGADGAMAAEPAS